MVLRCFFLFVFVLPIVCVEGCLSQETLPNPNDVNLGKVTLDVLIKHLSNIEKKREHPNARKDANMFLHSLSPDVLIGIVKRTYPHCRPPFEACIVSELKGSEQGRRILSEYYHGLFTKVPEQTVVSLVEGFPFDASYYYLVSENSEAERYCVTKHAGHFLAAKCECFSMKISTRVRISVDSDRRVLTIKDIPDREGHDLYIVSVDSATIKDIVNMLYSAGFFLDTGNHGYNGGRTYLGIGVFVHSPSNYLSPPYRCDHHSVTYFFGEIPDYLKRCADFIKAKLPIKD